MATRPKSRCPKCKTLHAGKGQCQRCRAKTEADRGTAAQRGYDREHEARFRTGVLTKNPYCVLCIDWGILEPATVADHYPLSRRQLVKRGLDPNDPDHGRGLCASCHGKETAKHQPGGWNNR